MNNSDKKSVVKRFRIINDLFKQVKNSGTTNVMIYTGIRYSSLLNKLKGFQPLREKEEREIREAVEFFKNHTLEDIE